ncbi:hypothetical protein GGX14DRAFT_399380 [Mycena pura]|uniref:Uncharacterized protein n=1 Tax=Mycena pura TaxID=153505 RepID=A0AAD6VBR9_9AGAR|nr:hypothetical protein GGX14DRAFT_399380 [Mycena pura]
MFSHLKTMLLPPAPSQSALRASNQDVVTSREAPPPPCLTPWRVVASFDSGKGAAESAKGGGRTTVDHYERVRIRKPSRCTFGERDTSKVELNREGGASATPFGGAQLLAFGERNTSQVELNRAGGGASATPFGGAQLLAFGERNTSKVELNRAGGGASATPFGEAQLPMIAPWRLSPRGPREGGRRCGCPAALGAEGSG